jgi:iron complex transport system permease protein
MSTLRIGTALSVRYRPRALIVGLACTVLALGVGVLALGSGDYPLGPADVVRTLTGGGTPAEDFVVNQLRLPRVVTALLVGAALGLAGALFQSLVRNPLGSPDVLGFTQGASAGALIVVITGGSSPALAGGAVLGGLVSGAAVYALARRGGVHGSRLVLVGIGSSAILTGVNGYLLTRTQLMDAARAILWLTGSLDGRGWRDAVPLLAALAVLGPAVLLGCGRALRVIEMGDDVASGLGVRVERVRLALLGCAVLLAALAAAAAGPVSYVALTAPQLARRLTRAPGPHLLAAACTGAALLLTADFAAQRLLPGHHLPVGVVTGVLGGGYLVRLLATERRAGRM